MEICYLIRCRFLLHLWHSLFPLHVADVASLQINYLIYRSRVSFHIFLYCSLLLLNWNIWLKRRWLKVPFLPNYYTMAFVACLNGICDETDDLKKKKEAFLSVLYLQKMQNTSSWILQKQLQEKIMLSHMILPQVFCLRQKFSIFL